MKKPDRTLASEKKREEWHGKITDFLDLDLSRNAISKDLINSFLVWKKPLQDKLSILDLPKLYSLSKNEKFYLLSSFFSSHDQILDEAYFDRKNNLVTPAGINYINQLLNDSIDYYKSYLLRTIGPAFIQKRNKSKSKISKISLRNTDDVLSFLDAVTTEKNSGADRQIYCSVLKIAAWINEYKLHEKEFSDAEKNFQDIKKEDFFPYFYNNKSKEIDYDLYKQCFDQPWDCDYVQLQTKSEMWNKAPIYFKSSWRIKDSKKIVLKMIWDRKYDNVKAIHDIYGIRNVVNNTKDGLFLLEYLWVNVLGKRWEIVNKAFLDEDIDRSIEIVNQYKKDLDPDFYRILSRKLEEERTKSKSWKINSKNSKYYRDIKIKWKMWNKKVEIQINLVNNKNEKWLSHHLIYVAKAKIATMIRLQSYIPVSIIYRYINEAVEKNIVEDKLMWKIPELLTLGGYKWDAKKISQQDKNQAIQKIFDHLFEKEKTFVQLDIAWKQHWHIYTNIDQRNAFHQNEEYEKMYPNGAQVKYEGKRTNRKI